MKFLDLFSGIGGFRRGLERSGHNCIGHVEIDKYANISYMAMYGLSCCRYGKYREENCCRICSKEVSEHCDGNNCAGEWFAKDIKQLTAGEIPRAEIWTFGFPCTDISLSGKRAGLAGERSGLFFTVACLLKSTPAEDKPGFLIVENVKHLLSSERGGDFTAVLFNLWEAGYDLEWQCVNSKDFGVPQHRERVYIVGYLRGIRGRKVFPVSGANPAVVRKVIGGCQGERVYDADGLSVTLTASGGGAGGKTGLYLVGTKKPEKWMECLKENGRGKCGAVRYAGFLTQTKAPDMTESARCLVAHYNAGITRFGQSSGVMYCMACDGKCVQARAALSPERENRRQNGRRFKEDGEPGFTLTTIDRHGVMMLECPWYAGISVSEAVKQGYVIVRGEMELTCPGGTASRGRADGTYSKAFLTEKRRNVLVYCRIRKLTPRECFRLQAFEDYLFDRAQAAGVSDSQLYKQAGNSVTVNIVYEIGLRLAEMEADIREKSDIPVCSSDGKEGGYFDMVCGTT